MKTETDISIEALLAETVECENCQERPAGFSITRVCCSDVYLNCGDCMVALVKSLEKVAELEPWHTLVCGVCETSVKIDKYREFFHIRQL